MVRRDKPRDDSFGRIDIIKFNKAIFQHFIAVLGGKTPTAVIRTLDNGKTFAYAHQETCQKLVTAIPDKLKREALVALMGYTGCPLCVEIIKMYPREYKAIFPHFMLHHLEDTRSPNKPFEWRAKRHECPMLVHLPLECRRKYIGQLKQHCKMCLETKSECICVEFWSRNKRSYHCKESIFICGHQEAEYKINQKRKQYDILFQEVQKFCTTAKM